MHNIQQNLTKLIKKLSHDEFIFDFLSIYDFPKSTIVRLKKIELNKLKEKGELLLRKKILFKIVNDNLYESIDTVIKNISGRDMPRFIIVTDFKNLLSSDTKIGDSLDIEFSKLPQHYDFFLPLTGVEKTQHQNEKIADIKAANNLARLFDEISKNNKHNTKEEKHALNIFLTRLLFCYFAEDTKIFQESQFTNSLASHTKESGEDVHLYLENLFKILNLKDQERGSSIPEYLKKFPYVNGKLFETIHPIPVFNIKSRKILIDLGRLDWGEINPDIFGSMMQAVMDSKERGDLGSHYTSVPNIMKVIKPLFLDELWEEFENSTGNEKKLKQLWDRLSKIKFFDPACGSGNFLIITYKEIRKIEIEIIKQLVGSGSLFQHQKVKLSQFYGIEISDFARETAMLSLYLAEHQMNITFEKELGIFVPTLPLKLGGNIVCGNATRLDWEQVCPKQEGDEIYIMGNPPYQGARIQSIQQKDDMKIVFGTIKHGDLDYISIWFYKGSCYIKGISAKLAFVSTNSISQGEQVNLLWPLILSLGIEINFAYKSFKWKNNAKNNAGVTVVIIGLGNFSKSIKNIYEGNHKIKTNNINAYLKESNNTIIMPRRKPISKILKPMCFGSMANDGGNLFITTDEYNIIKKEYPHFLKYIRLATGGDEFINNKLKYCLRIEDNDYLDSIKNDLIKKKIKRVEKYRLESKRNATRKLSKIPYKFAEIRHLETDAILIPATSSERRRYVPIGFINKGIVITNATNVIYNADFFIFGVVNSYIHNLWIRSVGGSLETRIRYSGLLSYNTFPFPDVTEKQKDLIISLGYNIIDEREKHSEMTIAQMYDPDKMPKGLRQAHHELDLAIEKCYRLKPFESDEERLEYLFALYEKMIEKEKQNNK